MARTKQTARQSKAPIVAKKKTTKTGFEAMKNPELKALCKANGLKKYAKLKKADLIALLKSANVAEPGKTPEQVKETTPVPKTPEKKIQKKTPQAPKKAPKEQVEEEKEAPLPFNLDKDESGFEDFIPKTPEKKIVKEIPQAPKKPSKAEIMGEVDKEIKKRMKKEILDKLEQEQKTQELLSQIDTDTLIRELKKRGFIAKKYVKIDATKIKMLKNTCEDLDMLSDDEDDE